MPRLDELFTVHRLCVDLNNTPKIQKRRTFAHERQKAINIEIDKLLAADLICEVTYPKLVANVVLVKKTNGK